MIPVPHWKSMKHLLLATLVYCLISGLSAGEPPTTCVTPDTASESAMMSRFKDLSKLEWKEVFTDPCTGDWRTHWTLDGLTGTVTNNDLGMTVTAGNRRHENADHLVLWTRASFYGDVRIDYTYTRLDDAEENVTILFVQATGRGKGEYAKDISAWSHLRSIPAMEAYYNFMNLYHISYAAFDNSTGEQYIRARRYLPDRENGIKGTALKPDFPGHGLFKSGVPHHITVIKKGMELYMWIRNESEKKLCHWTTENFPPVIDGRIGLRHMSMRSARYKDFRISFLSGAEESEVIR